eukprot:CAMPEP_0197633034 /NCGR_PEP_ID=MMETSP1338-20131121/9496_1 /TAXON_ID=43686 ORGANISM="Pelagodinium beii, Strain RCC1491" /NCGR_SAMPLE_ID=MMETSP1338 /ASSEMBLY_ACC=CAM_ASM_000754 /LENGTH=421 /DNA_ID=CAMNT_0043204617 /DNA_START=20 /DNA_END=1285 /DNA_ORIENTATION=+
MRLRLRCSTAYSLADLQWCMVHVPDHVLTIRDLATHVSRLLELSLRGGTAEPPQLLLDGFLVPHDEEVREVLRDDEVVDVEPNLPSAAAPVLALPAPAETETPSAGSKRPLALANLADGKSEKRQRRANLPDSAVMALGWQPQEQAKAADVEKSKASTAAPAEDDESSSDDEAAPKASADVARSRGKGASSAEATVLNNGGSHGESSAKEGHGIFVGGLPFGVDDAALRTHFEYYGPVEEASVVTNQHTGKSKGFGFVEFKAAETRDKVLADGDQEMMGKSFQVKPRAQKGKGGGKEGKGKEGGKSGKGKDGKGKKGGKDKGEGKGTAKNGNSTKAPQVRKMDTEDDDDEDSDDEDEEAAAPAPPKKAVAKQKQKEAENGGEALVMTEEMKQMMALGLPVAFTASEQLGGESDDEDEEDDE